MTTTVPVSKQRIFLGLSEVSGFYQGLSLGFKQLGIKVTRIDLSNHPFCYSDEQEKYWVRLFRKSMKKISSKENFLVKKFWKIIAIFCKVVIFISAVAQHDIFVFSYGTSFFRLYDLVLLKLLKKKIIFQFHGSDSRPPFMDGTLIHYYNSKQIANFTAQKKQQIKKINAYANAIIDIPPMGLFHEKPFINWLHIGLTVSVNQIPPAINKPLHTGVKILHAPSNPLAKGTEQIIATINRLKDQGYEIELIKICNQPNYKVHEALQQCDFVIDQLFADYAMPGFATESAWFGKPTIICGYASQLWQSLLPATQQPPTYYCCPEQLEQAIKLFYNDVTYRNNLAKTAQNFVSQQWHPQQVAKRYLQIIANQIPEHWWCYPKEIDYIHGCCVSKSFLQQYLQKFLLQHGKNALQLEDKPALAHKFWQFSGLK